MNNWQVEDIADNLAADLDGSLSGLGVDLNAAPYNMRSVITILYQATKPAFGKSEWQPPPPGLKLARISAPVFLFITFPLAYRVLGLPVLITRVLRLQKTFNGQISSHEQTFNGQISSYGHLPLVSRSPQQRRQGL